MWREFQLLDRGLELRGKRLVLEGGKNKRQVQVTNKSLHCNTCTRSTAIFRKRRLADTVKSAYTPTEVRRFFSINEIQFKMISRVLKISQHSFSLQ